MRARGDEGWSIATAGVAAALVAAALAGGGSLREAPSDDPLRRLDPARQEAARDAGWIEYLRSCRPCHGVLGGGDGPHAEVFGRPAPDLVRGSRGPDWRATVRDGGRGTPGAWAMPAFGARLGDGGIAAILAALAELRSPRGHAPPESEIVTYTRRCAPCHGVSGAADGPLAAALFPRPRDFRGGRYRLRSTPSGMPPRRRDVAATIARGMGDTAMGGFHGLGRATIDRLVDRLAALSAQPFGDDAAGTGMENGRGEAPGDLERGRALYDDARCWQCHGRDGRGDGPSGRELRDVSGHASLPSNLTKAWQRKGGPGRAAVARAIAFGLDGTPMPSYADVLEPDEIAALAAYVEALGRLRPRLPARLSIGATATAMPLDPAEAPWPATAAAEVPLGPQMLVEPSWERPAVDAIALSVLRGPTELGFRLAWDDRFADTATDDRATPAGAGIDAERMGRWQLPDQLALVLHYETATPVEPPMVGPVRGAGCTQVRWRWSADGSDLVPEPPACGRDARVRGRARFADGRWQLVVVLDGADDRAAPPSIPRALAIEVWDGASGERDTRHGLSGWMALGGGRAR